MTWSIRSRLTAWYSFVMVVVLVTGAMVVAVVQERLAYERLDGELERLMLTLEGVMRTEFGEGLDLYGAAEEASIEVVAPDRTLLLFRPDGGLLEVWGRPLDAAWQPPLTQHSLGTVTPGTGRLRALSRPVTYRDHQYVAAVMAPLDGIEAEHRELLVALGVGVLIALAIAGIGGWLVARQSLQPLADLAEQGALITERDPSGRLQTPHADELGRLARAFNAVLDRLASALHSQRQFMADASHELRTPVSVVRTTAQVALSQPARSEHEYRESIAIVEEQSGRLKHLVDTMFLLSRAEAHGIPLVREPLYIDDLVAESARALRVLANERQVTIRTSGDSEVMFSGDTTVVEGFPAPIGDAVINNGPGLMLIVEKQLGANTLTVTRGVEEALEQMKPALSGVAVDPTIFRPATFIEMSLENLSRALLVGCVLVILVLMVFLADWRTGLISSIAIPLSLLAAGLLLHYRGGTLDTMVLAGLVIALGEVVDDAIIDVENIVRRLRVNSVSTDPQSAIRVVLDASMEVRSAVLYGSLIVIVVFVPVFMLDGLAGAFFRPLALSYVLAILASLLVALTITPALALMLLPKHLEHRESRLVGGLKGRYRRMLPAFVDRPKTALGSLAALLLVTGLTVPLLGEEFLPSFREYDFLMHWVEKPGTSIEAMQRITARASRELMAVPGVRNFGAHIGRAEVADEVVGPNFTELWVSLDPSVDYEATVATIQSIVDGYPGLYRDLLTYLRERIKEVLTGASATIVVRVYGPDLEGLQTQAQTVRSVMAKVEGVADLTVQAQVLVPKVEVRFDPDRAAAFGLTPGEVRRAAATLVQGTKVGEFYEEQQLFDVVVWGAPEVRRNLDTIRALQVPVANGGMVPLGSVAAVDVTPTPNEITRENGSRRIDVTSNVRGRDLGAVARDIQAQLAGVSFPQGYYAEVLGEYAERQASSTRLTLLGAIAIAAIFLILLADFGSARVAMLVFLTLPFALVGAIVAAFLTGGVLSLGSLVGLVTVIGISARNGIMLISHYRHLELQEGMTFGRDLILRGSEERLAPILMTALATGLALVPIVLGGTRAGYEIEHPLAVVILGGLFTSTLLNLFIVPALYVKYGRSALTTADATV